MKFEEGTGGFYSTIFQFLAHCDMAGRKKIMTWIKEFTLQIEAHERGNMIFFGVNGQFNIYLCMYFL